RHRQPLLVPHVEPSLRAFKAALHGRYAIFPPLGVPSFSSCMCAVFSVNAVPVLKRFLWNDFPISAVLTRNAPNGCKKRFASLDSRWEARKALTWEASTASKEVVIRSCVWFTSRYSLPSRSHTSLVSTTGPRNAGCARERSSVTWSRVCPEICSPIARWRQSQPGYKSIHRV